MPSQNSISYRGNVIDKEENETVELLSETTRVIPNTIFNMSKPFRNLPKIEFVDSEVFYSDDDENFKKSYIRVDNNNNTQVVLALLNEITTNKLEQLDLYVYSVVHTFYANGRHYITNKQVAEKLAGGKLKSNHQLIKDVGKSLFKLSNTKIYLNHEEQIKNWNIPEKIEITPESALIKPLLNLESRANIIMNNNIVDGHEIVRSPALYEYDALYNQLSTLDDTLINTQRFLTHNKETLELKRVLITRIETMKRIRSNSPKSRINKKDISFKSLYDEVVKQELLDAPSKKRTNYLKHIENILSAFKNNGYIKNYRIEGNTKDGKIVIGRIYDKPNNKYL